MPRQPFRTRIARAGLDSLMADPRYLDGNHPEHGALVDTVQRGFQFIFDGPKDRARRIPTLTSPAARPGWLDGVLKDSLEARDRFEAAPCAERERQGRRVMLAALRPDGFPLPSGLEDKDDPTVKFPTPRAGEGKAALAGPDRLPIDKRVDEPRRREPKPTPRTAETKGARPAPESAQETGKEEPPFQPRRPLDESGKEIWPQHEDPRFNPDGTLKEGFAKNPALRWAAENSRYNPKTKNFEFYQDLPEFQRDTRLGQRGRWQKVKPKPRNNEFPETGDPNRRIPTPPPLPPGKKASKFEWAKYGVELSGWAIENFGDEVREFIKKEDKGR